jgi:4-hydroxybenzoate polyprenyltransferase
MFRTSTAKLAAGLNFATGLAFWPALYFTAAFLQYVHGVEPGVAGLYVAPFMVGAVGGNLVSGRAIAKRGTYRMWPIAGGVACIVGGVLLGLSHTDTALAVMLGGAWPGPHSVALALLYSVGAHGIMTLNDFKAIEGDRQMGVASLPVQLGAQGAARMACIFMLVPQVVVAVLLFSWQLPWHALAVLVLAVSQWPLMAKFLRQPVERALYVSAFDVPLFVSGMMVSAWGLRQLHHQGLA